jgi:hypothetical protein
MNFRSPKRLKGIQEPAVDRGPKYSLGPPAAPIRNGSEGRGECRRMWKTRGLRVPLEPKTRMANLQLRCTSSSPRRLAHFHQLTCEQQSYDRHLVRSGTQGRKVSPKAGSPPFVVLQPSRKCGVYLEDPLSYSVTARSCTGTKLDPKGDLSFRIGMLHFTVLSTVWC